MSRARRALSSTSLRPIGLPRALVVREDADATPLSVVRMDVRGRRGSEARIESVEDQWRVAEAWWREAPQARTYYRVILEGGRPLTLFRDDKTCDWFEQPYTETSRSEAHEMREARR